MTFSISAKVCTTYDPYVNLTSRNEQQKGSLVLKKCCAGLSCNSSNVCAHKNMHTHITGRLFWVKNLLTNYPYPVLIIGINKQILDCCRQGSY